MKIKKMIGFSNNNLILMKRVQSAASDIKNVIPMSTIFEMAVINAHAERHKKEDIKFDDKVLKRISLYLTEKSNAKLNELTYIYDGTIIAISNFIIEKAYKR